jgi:hypothetical protein
MRAAKKNNPKTSATKQPSSNIEDRSGATILIDAYPNDCITIHQASQSFDLLGSHSED